MKKLPPPEDGRGLDARRARGRLRLPLDGAVVAWIGHSVRFVEETAAEIVVEIVPVSLAPKRAAPSASEAAAAAWAPILTPPVPAALVTATDSSVAADDPRVEALPLGATNVVRFQADAADIARAIRSAAIVKPPAITPDGSAGYLFVIEQDRGYVVSRDADHWARAEFPLSAEVEGTFILPADRVRTCQFLTGVVTVTARTIPYEEPGHALEGNSLNGDLDEHFVEHRVPGGARTEARTHDPRLLSDRLGKRLAGAQAQRFSVTVLREAIAMAPLRKALHSPDSGADIIRVQGGTLSSPTFSFETASLGGLSLELRRQDLGRLRTFLNGCQGDVAIVTDREFTFLVAGPRAFAWRPPSGAALGASTPARPWSDSTVLTGISVAHVVQYLAWTATALTQRRKRITVIYEQATEGLRFAVTEGCDALSLPADARLEGDGPSGGSFRRDVNISEFKGLFAGARSETVELRLVEAPTPGFRTVERFALDGHPCAVSRFCQLFAAEDDAQAHAMNHGPPT